MTGSHQPHAPGGVLLPVAVITLLCAGGYVSWLGTRPAEGTAAPVRPPAPAAGSVVSMNLPEAALLLPPGPNRGRFEDSCKICHSPRLVFTQPPLAEKQWSEVVHKMVAVYGAPLNAAEEREIVVYLNAILGRSSQGG